MGVLGAAVTLGTDLLCLYCYHGATAPNPTLPVFAFMGQETVWAFRIKDLQPTPIMEQGEAGGLWDKSCKSS